MGPARDANPTSLDAQVRRILAVLDQGWAAPRGRLRTPACSTPGDRNWIGWQFGPTRPWTSTIRERVRDPRRVHALSSILLRRSRHPHPHLGTQVSDS